VVRRTGSIKCDPGPLGLIQSLVSCGQPPYYCGVRPLLGAGTCVKASRLHEAPSQADFRKRAKTNDVPIARLIGFEAKDIADGRATVVLAAGPQHANPMGTLHGGILCDIADAAMGIAFASTLAPDESFTTVELKINFFRPVWQAQLKAEGTVVRRGHTIGYVECTITDEQNRLVAKAASTCMVLRDQKAAGR
jgi:uncharacterized protein (TIGR00369 family)